MPHQIENAELVKMADNKVQIKRHLQVACAIIEQGGNVLAAQRSENMALPLKWEFPGGKIEHGETAADCLARELFEELGIAVDFLKALPPATHDYQDFTITLHPFICKIQAGDIILHEHNAITWIAPHHMTELDWAAADLPVIGNYLTQLDGAGDRI